MSLTNEDKEWIAGRIDAAMQQTNARIEQVETALLTEFHKWASPAEMRARTHAAAIRAIDAEIEYLSDRVTKLEGKPPQSPTQ
jgi:citrate lyase gamma subunit